MKYNTWEELEFKSENILTRYIIAYGFEKPSPIQQKAIKPTYDGEGCDCSSTIWNWKDRHIFYWRA